MKMASKIEIDEDTECFQGVPMEVIHRGCSPWTFVHLPPLEIKKRHEVLCQLPRLQFDVLPPAPMKGKLKWDENHVKLPCSTRNTCSSSVKGNDAKRRETKPRWGLIQLALLKPIMSSHCLEDVIIEYNQRHKKQWKFHGLHDMFDELDEVKRAVFFTDIIPKIVDLARQLPDLIPNAIPLLQRNSNRSISLSQHQISCLLANAFLCTYPTRLKQITGNNNNVEKAAYSEINFSTLFQLKDRHDREKIRCICVYFEEVCKNVPRGVVTFTRRKLSLKDIPEWEECESSFDSAMVHITSKYTKENNGQDNGLLQVDFAHKIIGRNVLESGCNQEEILFMMYPELLVSNLFTEKLGPRECLLVGGCERYNTCSGYGPTFRWQEAYIDSTPFDDFGRKKSCIVAIDALYYNEPRDQYTEKLMLMELEKAFVGFYHGYDETLVPGVATGNWGHSDPYEDKPLKFLYQLMVCCVTNRPLVYHTDGDIGLRDKCYRMYEYLAENKVTIANLWNILKGFQHQNLDGELLYEYILQSHKYGAVERPTADPAKIKKKTESNNNSDCKNEQGGEIVVQAQIHSAPIDSDTEIDDKSAQPYGMQRLGVSVVKGKDKITVKQSIPVNSNFSKVNQSQIDAWKAYGDKMRSRLDAVSEDWDTIHECESVPAHSEFTIKMEIEDAGTFEEAVGGVVCAVDGLPGLPMDVLLTEQRHRILPEFLSQNSVVAVEAPLEFRKRELSADMFDASGEQSGEQSEQQSEEQSGDY